MDVVYLVIGPKRDRIAGFEADLGKARDIAFKLNALIDGCDPDSDDLYYSILSVATASSYWRLCEEMGVVV